MRKRLMEARGLCKVFPGPGGGEVHALRDVNLTILESEFVTIIGEDGAGKSTLLRVLGFRERPTAGRLLFLGRDMGSLSEAELEAMGPPPGLVLLDEPTSEAVTQLLGTGPAMVIATSDMSLAAMGHSIYRMKAGQLVKIAPLEGSD